jgi:hypothetical protein
MEMHAPRPEIDLPEKTIRKDAPMPRYERIGFLDLAFIAH